MTTYTALVLLLVPLLDGESTTPITQNSPSLACFSSPSTYPNPFPHAHIQRDRAHVPRDAATVAVISPGGGHVHLILIPTSTSSFSTPTSPSHARRARKKAQVGVSVGKDARVVESVRQRTSTAQVAERKGQAIGGRRRVGFAGRGVEVEAIACPHVRLSIHPLTPLPVPPLLYTRTSPVDFLPPTSHVPRILQSHAFPFPSHPCPAPATRDPTPPHLEKQHEQEARAFIRTPSRPRPPVVGCTQQHHAYLPPSVGSLRLRLSLSQQAAGHGERGNAERQTPNAVARRGEGGGCRASQSPDWGGGQGQRGERVRMAATGSLQEAGSVGGAETRFIARRRRIQRAGDANGASTAHPLVVALRTRLVHPLSPPLQLRAALLAPDLDAHAGRHPDRGRTVGSFVSPAQKAWLAAIDVRIKLLTSVLGQLLPIKLGAYESALERKINALRKIETQALKRFMYLICIAGTLSNIGSSASFLVTLAAYATMLAYGWGYLPPLDVSRIFTLFTIVNILGGPLNMIGQSLPSLFASYASLGRIQGFLQLPEKSEAERDFLEEADLVDVSDDGVKVSTVHVSLK
ncbi:hypothetical protein B0H11DRAFT_2310423 [Mycena galericulata]|nr:hypothetical protein B0H11DRAFT_2310423 [Mycena galericulata]